MISFMFIRSPKVTPVLAALMLVLLTRITVKIFKELCSFFCNLDTFTMVPNVASITADHEPESDDIKVVKHSVSELSWDHV